MTSGDSRTGPFIAIAIAVGAIVAFFLPFGTFFGVVLLLLCGAYVAALATGMTASAGLGDTAQHLADAVSRARSATLAARTPTPPPAPGPTPPMPPTPFAPPTQQVTTPAPVVPDAAPPSAPAQPVDESADFPSDRPPVSLTKSPHGTPTSAPALQVPPPVDPPTPPTIPAPTPPGPSRSRIPLLAAALTTVLLLVVGAGAFVGWRVWTTPHSDRPTASGFPAGMVHRSFPTVPSASFAITPEQLGAELFTRPNYSIGGEESTGFLRSDRFLITGMGNGALVAIDPSTGREAWRQTSYSGLTCSDVFDDDTIGCSTPRSGLILLSAADGSKVADLPGDYQRVKKLGDKYAYAKDEGSTATVSLGTRTNPTEYWTHTESIPGGTRTYLEVSRKIVSYTDGSATGGWSLAYDESGKRVSQTTDFGTLLGDDEFTNMPGDSALVYDSTARMRYMTSSRPRQPRLYAPGPGISVAFTDDSAVDPSDGRVLWQRPLTASSGFDSGASAVVGSVAIFQSDVDATTVGVDIPTGRTIWRTQLSAFSYDLVTDGRHLVGLSEEDGHAMYAIDVATGQRSWGVTMPDTGDYPKVAAVGDDIVVVGSRAIIGFRQTGGTATLYDGKSGSAAGTSPGVVTPCATPPTVTPQNFAVDAQNLVVRLRFTAGCRSGDVLSNAAYQVTIRDQSSVIASSTFDLSSSPVPVAGDGGTVREFSFPAGTYYRLPSSLSGGSGSSTSVGAGGETVQCSGTGTDRVATGQEYSSSGGSDTTPIVGTTQAGPQQGLDTTTNAIDALRAQANADRPLVQSQYLDRWLAQISAKQVRTPPMMATDVDDRTMVAWTPEQILRQHLDLRARYPEVRLLFSDEWRTFDLRGWWITVAQPNVLDAAGANAWCDSKAIAPNQCFAKLVSNSRGSEGTTAYRPGTTG